MSRITNCIRRLRFDHGEMTQEELARTAGCTRQTIIALEAGKYTLTVSASLPEAGIVLVRSPEPAFVYSPGTVLELEVEAFVGYQFNGWGGDLSGTDNPAQLTMDDDKTVTALFTRTD